MQPPVALLAGVAVAEPLVRAFARPGPGETRSPNGHPNGKGRAFPASTARQLLDVGRSPAGAVIAVLFIFALAGSLVTKGGLAGEGVFLTPLQPGERELMAWVAQSTPADARVLVVPRGTWETDREGEWFPVLARRRSVATVQGFEWAPGDGFRDRQDQYWDAYDCGFQTTDCLDAWLREYPSSSFRYVWIPRIGGIQCCGTLAQSLNQDSGYTRIYDGEGGTLWRRELSLP